MSTTAPSIGPPDEGIAAPILIQGLAQYLCQGVIFSQGLKYWARRAGMHDSWMRLYVATLVFMSVFQTALETYKVWLEVIVHEHWYFSPLHCIEFLINGIVTTICELFLVRRCWKITEKNIYVLVGLSSLSALTLSASIYLTVKIQHGISSASDYADPLKAGMWAFPCWVYTSLFIALVMTTILSYSLWRRRTGMAGLDKTVIYIIELTWETSTLPTIAMILAAAIYSSKELTKVRHLDLFFILLSGKLYTLGILRTINCRSVFRERLASADCDIGRTSLSNYKWGSTTLAGSGENQKPIGPNETPPDDISQGADLAMGESASEQQLMSLASALEEGRRDVSLAHREQRSPRADEISTNLSDFMLHIQ